MVTDLGTYSRTSAKFNAQLLAKDTDKRMIYGYALVSDVIDSDGNKYSGAELEKAVELFMLRYKVNEATVDTNHTNKDKLAIVESKIERDNERARWFVGVKVLDETEWTNILLYGVNGFSFVGTGKEIPVNGVKELFDIEIDEISVLYPTEEKLNIPANPAAYITALIKNENKNPAQAFGTLAQKFINLMKGQKEMKPEEVKQIVEETVGAKLTEAVALVEGLKATVAGLGETLRAEFNAMLVPVNEAIAKIAPVQQETVALQKSASEVTELKAQFTQTADTLKAVSEKLEKSQAEFVALKKAIDEAAAKRSAQLTPEEIAAQQKKHEATGLDRTIAAMQAKAAGK